MSSFWDRYHSKGTPRIARALWTLLGLLLAPAARAEHIRVLDLPAKDLIYDAGRRLLYASVPATGGPRANSVTVIDPARGTPGRWIPVGGEPDRLALSDGGRYLYVALRTAGAVRRIDLRSGKATLLFFVGRSGMPPVITDLEAVPGEPHAVAVAWAGSELGIGVFDHGVPRPQVAIHQDGVYDMAFGASSDRLYGMTGGGFRRWRVTPAGLTPMDTFPGLRGGEIVFREGRLYVAGGQVIDSEAGTVLGRFSAFPELGSVAPDPARGRVYFLGGAPEVLRAYDTETFLPVGALRIHPYPGPARRLIRWGDDGLAFVSDGAGIYLVRTSLGEPSPPRADLKVTVTAVPRTVRPGGHVVMEVAVTNAGPDPATDVSVTQMLGAGSELLSVTSSQGASRPRGREVVTALGTLPAGQTARIRLRLRAAALPVGRGEVNLFALALGKEVDPITGDNEGGDWAQTLPPLTGRDLTGFWEAVRPSCAGGPPPRRERCTLQGLFHLHNQGREAAGPSRVRFYLSADAVWDAGDRLLREIAVPTLEPGRTRPIVLRPLSVGSRVSGYWLLAVVDAGRVIAERDEENNVIAFGPIS